MNTKKIVLILALVAVLAVVLAVFTAEHVSGTAILIIAGVVVVAAVALNLYISSQKRKLDDRPNAPSSDDPPANPQ
ncbi:hypothetical protein GF377_10285 [candidate division GN15 bacterium]|nr:hypothetical protein [candidate division GN15 bacterium]